MKTVLIAQEISPETIELMKGKVDVIVSPSPEDEVVRKHISGCHGLIVRSHTRLSRRTIFASDCLEVIARTGAGVDNIDLDAATERGIPVCHTPEANKSSVAEHTFALMLALARGIPLLDNETRQGNWKSRDFSITFDLKGRTLGIIGLGRIGREVARLAFSFGMTVLAYDPFVDALQDEIPKDEHRRGESVIRPELPKIDIAKIDIVSSLEKVFKSADIVSIHIPLTNDTKGLINANLLNLLKPTSILINTSRGAVVDEPALIESLSEEKLAGAGLDVFSSEPLSRSNPLCRLSNVVLTPHSAALTKECRLRMASDAVTGLLDVLEGRTPRWVANRKALQSRVGSG